MSLPLDRMSLPPVAMSLPFFFPFFFRKFLPSVREMGKTCVQPPTSLRKLEDAQAETMQEVAKHRAVLTSPRIDVKEVIPNGIRSAADEVPANERVGDMSVKVPPEKKQPPLVKHAAGMWEPASSGSDAWSTTPTTRMLSRNEEAASQTRLRSPLGLPARGKALILSSMIASAPPAQPDSVEMTKEEVQEAIFEVLYMESWGSAIWFRHAKVGVFLWTEYEFT